MKLLLCGARLGGQKESFEGVLYCVHLLKFLMYSLIM